MNDAARVVHWLNASHGTASHRRVVFLRNELEMLPVDWGIHSTRPAWKQPGAREGFDKDHRQLELRHLALNELLSTYAFRPRVTHRVFRFEWVFGMVPDENKRWFTVRRGDETISEADSVMVLTRLAAAGDLRQVRLCDTCKKLWLVSARSIDRFCSKKCREASYAESAAQREREAKNQREYRLREKRAAALATASAKRVRREPLTK